MAATTKNRKKSSGGSSTNNNNDSTSTGSTGDEMELNTQLDRALTAVVKNQYTVIELHKQWKLHLLRLSYLVIILTFHQCQLPITNCIKQIKVNEKIEIKINFGGNFLVVCCSQAAGGFMIFSYIRMYRRTCSTRLPQCDFSPFPFARSTCCLLNDLLIKSCRRTLSSNLLLFVSVSLSLSLIQMLKNDVVLDVE